MTILEEIISKNLPELKIRKRRLPLTQLEKLISEQPKPLSLADALRGDGVKLIAEVKKASPSRGVIRPDFDAVSIAGTYTAGGASAISVLTESRYFQGSLDYLADISRALERKEIPLLRKDFIHDTYQVYESRAYRADSLLLIVAILSERKLNELLEVSHRLDMECLVEVHNEAEVDIAVRSGARIIGINNRDLNTFTVDINTTRRLKPLIPHGRIVVSESGIRDRGDVEKLEEWGVDAVLIGEALMSAPDIGAKMRELL
ncbi:Indole-3-glycerol phosphate synthase [subsurface metagenome]